MSVLYKALQKAEKENEQRQTVASGKGFDAGRIAGSGEIKLARGQKLNWRVAGLGAVGLIFVLVLGIFFVTKTQPIATPRVATLMPPQPKPAQPSTPSAGVTPSGPQTAQTAAAPATVPAEVKSAGAQLAQAPAPPAAAVPQQASQSGPPVNAQSAVPARASPAAPSMPAPDAQKPEAAPPAPRVAETETPSAPAETQVAKAEPPAAAAKGPVATPVPANAKAVEIPADSPAQMLNPPIAISRSDFALSGVGRAVQVRQIAPDAQNNVGAGYNALLRGEYDTALAFYDKALAKEPTSVLGLLGRGAALQKLHRNEDAQEAYSKALKVDPENREALTNITSLISERAPAEALNRLLDLEKEYPAFSPIKAQIGLLYAKTGSMDPALDYLRRAIALSPESVMYQYNLAIVLDHMNLHEQAADAYERVLSAISTGQAPPELSSTEIERRVHFLRAH